MARYRAKTPQFIGVYYYQTGEVFESDLPPGRNWEPLDAKARAAVAKRDGLAEATKAEPEHKPDDAEVSIPDDWLEGSKVQVIALAKKLGAPNTSNFTKAVAWIEKIAAERAASAEMEGAV